MACKIAVLHSVHEGRQTVLERVVDRCVQYFCLLVLMTVALMNSKLSFWYGGTAARQQAWRLVFPSSSSPSLTLSLPAQSGDGRVQFSGRSLTVPVNFSVISG